MPYGGVGTSTVDSIETGKIQDYPLRSKKIY